jgi:hypothetical protein
MKNLLCDKNPTLTCFTRAIVIFVVKTAITTFGYVEEGESVRGWRGGRATIPLISRVRN